MANYGDRLFPLITKEQLTARLPGLELGCNAPIDHADLPLTALFPGGGTLDPARREYLAWHVAAVLIGGGDLMRFDVVEPGYDGQGRADPSRPYAAFLLFIWTEVRPTILWNAPGVHFPFEAAACAAGFLQRSLRNGEGRGVARTAPRTLRSVTHPRTTPPSSCTPP